MGGPPWSRFTQIESPGTIVAVGDHEIVGWAEDPGLLRCSLSQQSAGAGVGWRLGPPTPSQVAENITSTSALPIASLI